MFYFLQFLLVETLCSVTCATSLELLESLKISRKSGLFLTSILFGDEGIVFFPTDSDIYSAIGKVIESAVSCVAGIFFSV